MWRFERGLDLLEGTVNEVSSRRRPVFDGAYILYLPYSYSDRMARGGIRGVHGIYDFIQKTVFFISKNLIKL